MAPYVSAKFPFSERIATLGALFGGYYEINVVATIHKMAERIAERGPGYITCSAFRSTANVNAIREAFYVSQERITMIAEDLELEGENAEATADMMAETACFAKHQVEMHLVATALYGILGVAGLIAKKRLAAAIGISASVVFLAMMLEELEARSAELNEQFDCLREICNDVAETAVNLIMRRDNHNFAFRYAKTRFGDALDHPEIADPYETFDPDACI